MRYAVEQFRHDAFDTFKRVGDGARLLENFLLHVVAVRPEFDRAAVRQHRAHRPPAHTNAFVRAIDDPVLARLQIDHVAFFKIDDLIGDAGQRHGIAGQKIFGTVLAHAQDQRRPGTRTNHAVWLVAGDHCDSVGALQLQHRGLDRFKQVTVVQAVDQMRDHLGVGLARKDIAAGLQRGAQCIVVFDDAVVHERHACRLGAVDALACTVAEMRVRVVHDGRAVRRPTRVGDAGSAFDVIVMHLSNQVSHA